MDDQGYTSVYKNPGDYQLTKDNVGSRYALVAFRTGVNMSDPEEFSQASPGAFVQPNRWNQEEMLALRAAYNQ